jgi:hypothetical protein
MRLLTTVATGICFTVAACGGGKTAPPKTIHVSVTHKVFSTDQAKPGDTVCLRGRDGFCRDPNRGQRGFVDRNKGHGT